MTKLVPNIAQWWSWADVVRHADRLGIPNFQRGAVWGTGNRVALLESLYEASPCGSFVLWRPELESGQDPWRNGVPLCAGPPHADPVWLVDGQQRTRALLDTFRQLNARSSDANDMFLVREADRLQLQAIGGALFDSSATAENDDPSEVPQEKDKKADEQETDLHLWMVVLPAMSVFDRGAQPYFGHHSESRNIQRGAWFRYLSPRVRQRFGSKGTIKPNPPHPVGTVPLAALLLPSSIFAVPELRQAAQTALAGLDAGAIDHSRLNDLIPWGPQFLTGHAMELASNGDARPMRWADIATRLHDPNIQQMIQCLTGLFAPQWSAEINRFQQIFSGERFAAGWLPPGHVGDAIDAYVRINRAGIRVRADERALALLSRARPEILDDLAQYMAAKDGKTERGSRRDLLAHESEKQMGFSIWMTTVTRYVALALFGKSARRWLGVSAIDKNTFSYRLDRVGPNETDAGRNAWSRRDFKGPEEVLQECAARATAALLLIDSVLSQELNFDHRMARPSIRAIQPMLDLFYRLPTQALTELSDDSACRSAIAKMLHWSLLAPYLDNTEFERLIVTIHGLDEADENDHSGSLRPWTGTETYRRDQLRRALCRYRNALLACSRRKREADSSPGLDADVNSQDIGQQLSEVVLETFTESVWNARSLQHPTVGWVYAVERHGAAREFDWPTQLEAYEASDRKQGVPAFPQAGPDNAMLLQAGTGFASPEKQHVIPFSFARRIVDKGGSRSTSSPSNAIGNLTWLSNRQNALDALSDRWAVMDPDRDGANLAARGMLAPTTLAGQPCTVLEVYEQLSDLVLSDTMNWSTQRERAHQLLEAFNNGRTQWLIDEMRQWLTASLPPQAHWWLDGPTEPLEDPVEIGEETPASKPSPEIPAKVADQRNTSPTPRPRKKAKGKWTASDFSNRIDDIADPVYAAAMKKVFDFMMKHGIDHSFGGGNSPTLNATIGGVRIINLYPKGILWINFCVLRAKDMSGALDRLMTFVNNELGVDTPPQTDHRSYRPELWCHHIDSMLEILSTELVEPQQRKSRKWTQLDLEERLEFLPPATQQACEKLVQFALTHGEDITFGNRKKPALGATIGGIRCYNVYSDGRLEIKFGYIQNAANPALLPALRDFAANHLRCPKASQGPLTKIPPNIWTDHVDQFIAILNNLLVSIR